MFNKGAMLTGKEIEKQIKKGNIIISPYDPKCLNPNSINLKLHPDLKIYCLEDDEPLDMYKRNDFEKLEIPDEGLVLQPGVLYIGRTVERTSTDKFIPMINGRSSVGRLGISVHVTAGFGDIGFDGTWTLEITVVHPVRVYKHCQIAQLCYFTPNGKITQYEGRYNGQMDPTISRMYI